MSTTRKITARFKSQCAACGGGIYVGNLIVHACEAIVTAAETVKRGRGRAPKTPEDRRGVRLDLPMTDAEKAAIFDAAAALGKRPVTWARETLLRAAKRAKR